MKKKVYYLKSKNTLVAIGTVINYESDSPIFEETIVREDLLPYGYKDIYSFIDSRKPPKNREFVSRIMTTLDYDKKVLWGYIEITLGLSLNDTYWVLTEETRDLKYEDYNLYENQFSEVLSLVAFTGNTQRVSGLNTSPEFTTQGVLRKCWGLRENGDIVLYKSGTHGYANAGLEPFSEYLTNQISKKLGLEYVEYELEKYKGVLVSTSKCFCNKNISYAPMALLWNDNPAPTINQTLSKAFKIYGKQPFINQFLLDYVTWNYDRHLNNYGVYYNPNTMEIIGPAKIYDNGAGLLPGEMESDFKNPDRIKKYMQERYHAIGYKFQDILEEFSDNKEMRDKAANLVNFRFEPQLRYNLPEWRIKALENFVQDRVKEVLNSHKRISTPVSISWEDRKKLFWDK